MNFAELAAQLIMIDLDGPQLQSRCREHLGRYHWGGVLLFARNIHDRPQLHQLMKDLRELGDPLVAVDQEGGLVDRVRFPDTVLTPGPMALAATGDPDLTREAHAIMGQQLADMGFHLDFAPCLDINSNPDNPIIGVRSFGDSPQLVAAHGRAACEGLRQGGVAATVKHFPGHGDCHLDTHLALPTLKITLEQLLQRELVPFQQCLEAGAEACMTAHIVFGSLDSRPATLSAPILTGLLRHQMGYQGVVFTDSMEMQALADHYGTGEACVLALEAGADMIIARSGYALQVESVEAIVAALESGRLDPQALQESLHRLQHLRLRLHGVHPTHPPASYALPAAPVDARPLLDHNPRFADQEHRMRMIVEKTITVVRNRENLLPIASGRVLLLSPDLLPLTPLGEMTPSERSMRHLRLEGLEVNEAHYPAETRGPALDHLLTQARQADTVIFTVYARHRLPDATRELGQHLLAANPRTILVSLSSPYVLRDLPDSPAFVCSYNYTPLSLQALGRVLSGQVVAQGRLPVTIPGLEPSLLSS